MSARQLADVTDILLLEDDPDLRQLLFEELGDAGYTVATCGNLAEARHYLHRQLPQLIISDLRLPDGEGLSLLQDLQAMPVKPGLVMITAFGTIDQAVDALKQGADDFLTKPLDLEHLRLTVERMLKHQRLEQELNYYRRLLGTGAFHGMIGSSPAMHTLFSQIRQIAQADGPVLISGESGTGKELVARAIARESSRAEQPFIAINCGGIAANLLESELFGHAAGAFTGANKARRGLFAAADGGTLLLDEIGEMPLEMQSSLLRILQDGRVRPVGSNTEQALDVRVIAASNRDLMDEVRNGHFREDLFYRLETFTIEVPPLRHRGDDLEHLVMHHIDQLHRRRPHRVTGLTADALAQLRAYDFPGNVRELANIIERAVTFCDSSLIAPEHLPERIQQQTKRQPVAITESWVPPGDKGQLLPLAEIERDYIDYVLTQVEGNKRRAAEILEIGRRTLYRWLEDRP